MFEDIFISKSRVLLLCKTINLSTSKTSSKYSIVFLIVQYIECLELLIIIIKRLFLKLFHIIVKNDNFHQIFIRDLGVFLDSQMYFNLLIDYVSSENRIFGFINS